MNAPMQVPTTAINTNPSRDTKDKVLSTMKVPKDTSTIIALLQ